MPATIHPTSATRRSSARGASAGLAALEAVAAGVFDWLNRLLL
jgi:hypothetical protein